MCPAKKNKYLYQNVVVIINPANINSLNYVYWFEHGLKPINVMIIS